MRPRAAVIYCGFLFTLSAASIDIMLPALDEIRLALDTSSAATKMSITFYLFAFGVGQLYFGPLADRVGRRAAIIFGIALYLVGTVVCATALNIQMLLAGRLLGGFGAATGQVVGRAIIRDLFSGVELARNMALGLAIFSLGPLVAPLLGYGLAELAGWRSVFGALLLFGLALLLIAVVWLPETCPAKNPRAQQLGELKAGMRRFFRNSISLAYFAVGSWVAIAMYFYLANAQHIFAEGFGIRGLGFSVLFASHGIGIIIGQMINRRLLLRIGIINTTVAAAALLGVVTAAIAATAYAGWLGGYGFAALMFMFAVGFLVVVSNAAALAMQQHGQMAGFASALIGFGAGTIGGASASALTVFSDGKLLPWSLLMMGITTVTLAGLLVLRRRGIGMAAEV